MSITQVAPRVFPSGNSKCLAVINVTEAYLTKKFGVLFEDDDRSQAGPERIAYIELSDGRLIQLSYPIYNPIEGMRIFIDISDDIDQYLSQIIRELGITETDILWKSDQYLRGTWKLMRNGETLGVLTLDGIDHSYGKIPLYICVMKVSHGFLGMAHIFREVNPSKLRLDSTIISNSNPGISEIIALIHALGLRIETVPDFRDIGPFLLGVTMYKSQQDFAYAWFQCDEPPW